jgi:hypothetical protein
MTRNVTSEFQELFQGFSRAHGAYTITSTEKTKVGGSAITKRGQPGPADWDAHLSGAGVGLGIIPLRDDGKTVLWGVIDIDQYPISHADLERECKDLPVVITKSKSGGAHIWLFCRAPVDARIMQQKLSMIACALGYPHAEIFPKQTMRTSAEDIGNWINLPYYGDSRKAIHEGKEIGLDEFLRIAAQRKVSAEMSKLSKASGDAFASDGPPCIEGLVGQGGFQEGSRNDGLFAVAIYVKSSDPANWEPRVSEANQKYNNPPLTQREVDVIVKSLRRKDYKYPCSRHPLQSRCNRALCTERAYGVRSESSEVLNVTIRNLRKLDTTPPRWSIEVDGQDIELPSTADFQHQPRFQKFCIERLHKIVPQVSKKRWLELWQKLLDDVSVIDAPAEASEDGYILAKVKEYCDIRYSDERDSIAGGNVWFDQGFAHIRPGDLIDYLKRNGIPALAPPNLYSLLLTHCGATEVKFEIKGAVVTCWRISLPARQNAPFDIPSFKTPI